MADIESKSNLLIVDDQREILNSLRRLLQKEYVVETAESGLAAIEKLSKKEFAVILSDQRMPGMDGTTFLQKSLDIQPESVRILITGYSDINATIEAVNKAKIFQYISKPFEPEDLKQIINRAVQHYQLKMQNIQLQKQLEKMNANLKLENESLHQQLDQDLDLGKMIGSSPAMLKVFKLIRKVASTPTTVLLEGETGTGKELTAKLIHHNSDRKKNMFVAQNCGAIPDTLLQSELFGHERGAFTGAIQSKKGLFELAHEGTIFLDEIGDTTPALQLGLLRVLQEGEIKPLGSNETRKVNVRVIAATNKNLQEEVRKGTFREDLFYRLNVFPIRLPPLRERTEDLPDLVQFFVNKYADRIGKKVRIISLEIMNAFKGYSFPGNIRELENEIERMVTLCDEGQSLTMELLSPRFKSSGKESTSGLNLQGNLKEVITQIEISMISGALKTTNGNILKAADRLGISRVGLHKMLKRHNIDVQVYKN